MSLPDAAMIFAAGFGTRMRELTRDTAKPLLEVAGRSLLDRALDRVAGAGIDRIVVNAHHHADKVAAAIGNRAHLSREEEILETGGGLALALPLLDADPVLTVNPDAVWADHADPLAALSAAWAERMEACLLLVPRDQCRAHAGPGDFFLAEDKRLVRRGDRDSAPYVYSGWQILRTERIARIGASPYSLNRVWDEMLAAGTLHGTVCDAPWVDVGTPEGIGVAEAMLAEAC
ncbi:nucleotidyltransferase family protein [Roseobacter sp. HKCCA0434]|uniref:nucleotidyltransferase family protein n=1 Tax=Roseobacter sp. HKCCA0434 TaxID=3079297 RepID=UPI002905F279|nr:nucleotidyltransferase family protein [Roseobacter sp. HKCCA0434]